MKKNTMVIFVLFLLNLTSVFSQTNISFMTGEQVMVKKTIDSSLFIIRQDYVLRDTVNGVDFGFNNKPFFGSAYTLGFMADSLLWFISDVFKPWANDTNHLRFNRSYGYVPVLSKIYYRGINDSVFRVFEYHIPQFSNSFDSLIMREKIIIVKPKETLSGLMAKSDRVTNDGWVIFVHTENPIKDCDTCNVLLSIYKVKQNANNRGTIENQPQVNNIIGGIYVTPLITTGKIEMFISDYSKKIMNWVLKQIPEIEYTVETTIDEGTNGADIQDLNPIEGDAKSKKSKKNKKK